MKFRYYITDLFEGCVTVTNDTNKAKNYCTCSDYFVVDSETGKWMSENEEIEIEEA